MITLLMTLSLLGPAANPAPPTFQLFAGVIRYSPGYFGPVGRGWPCTPPPLPPPPIAADGGWVWRVTN